MLWVWMREKSEMCYAENIFKIPTLVTYQTLQAH